MIQFSYQNNRSTISTFLLRFFLQNIFEAFRNIETMHSWVSLNVSSYSIQVSFHLLAFCLHAIKQNSRKARFNFLKLFLTKWKFGNQFKNKSLLTFLFKKKSSNKKRKRKEILKQNKYKIIFCLYIRYNSMLSYSCVSLCL